jgi:hypothetical protein
VVSNTKEIVKKNSMENASSTKHIQMKVHPPEANQCELISGPQLQFQASAIFSKRNWSLFTKQLIACTTQFIIDNWPSTTHPARKSCLKYSRKCALHFQLCKASSPVNPKGSQPL